MDGVSFATLALRYRCAGRKDGVLTSGGWLRASFEEPRGELVCQGHPPERRVDWEPACSCTLQHCVLVSATAAVVQQLKHRSSTPQPSTSQPLTGVEVPFRAVNVRSFNWVEGSRLLYGRQQVESVVGVSQPSVHWLEVEHCCVLQSKSLCSTRCPCFLRKDGLVSSRCLCL